MSATVILVTGAGSGFGLLAARSLAKHGHIVYGGYYPPHGIPEETQSSGEGIVIHNVPLDITNQDSVDVAVKSITQGAGRLDCVVHNAGHMCVGPAEAFSAEQFHQYYDINVVGAHRLNQAVLPLMRKARAGHLVWVSSSSAKHGSGPLLAPYFAAKAAMHSLAVSLSTEIACWGIETSIIVPGIFPSGTNHFLHAGKPASADIAAEYMEGPFKGIQEVQGGNVAKNWPKNAAPQLVADAITAAVSAARGSKPFLTTVDPFKDGSDAVFALADQTHEEFLRRCGIYDMCSLHID